MDGLNQAWFIVLHLLLMESWTAGSLSKCLIRERSPTGKVAGVLTRCETSQRTVQGSAAQGWHPHSSFQLSSLLHSPCMGKPFSWLLGDQLTTTESQGWGFFWNPSRFPSGFESWLFQLTSSLTTGRSNSLSTFVSSPVKTNSNTYRIVLKI